MKQEFAQKSTVKKILYAVDGREVPALEGFGPQTGAVPDALNLDLLRGDLVNHNVG
jgi:hypothetical protein